VVEGQVAAEEAGAVALRADVLRFSRGGGVRGRGRRGG
jgi:hypothetical protein